MNDAAHPRLAHIDGLRGLAALLVLYQHLLEYVGRAAPAASFARLHLDWTLGWLDFGKVGVVVFFAISGYIVPSSFSGASPRLGFVVSRVFRLYPAYWVSLAAAALLLPRFGTPAFPVEQLFANTTMLQRLFRHPDVLGVYWTLLIELFFYALCLALFCAGRLSSARSLAIVFGTMLGVAVAAAPMRAGGIEAAPVGLPLYLAVMLFGSCLRLAVIERDAQARRYAVRMFGTLLLVIPLAWATAYDEHSHKESVFADIAAFWLALLIFVVTLKRQTFAVPPLIYAGAISYSVYLIHPLALELARQMATFTAWPGSGWVQAAATLVLTLAAAHVVHHHVERPSIRFGRQLLSALSRRTGARAA